MTGNDYKDKQGSSSLQQQDFVLPLDFECLSQYFHYHLSLQNRLILWYLYTYKMFLLRLENLRSFYQFRKICSIAKIKEGKSST